MSNGTENGRQIAGNGPPSDERRPDEPDYDPTPEAFVWAMQEADIELWAAERAIQQQKELLALTDAILPVIGEVGLHEDFVDAVKRVIDERNRWNEELRWRRAELAQANTDYLVLRRLGQQKLDEKVDELSAARAELASVQRERDEAVAGRANWKEACRKAEAEGRSAGDTLEAALAAMRRERDEARAALEMVGNWGCVGPDAPASTCRAAGVDFEEMCVGCAACELYEQRDRARSKLKKLKKAVAR